MLQLNEDQILVAVQNTLSGAAMFVGGPLGAALGVGASVLPAVFHAVSSGGEADLMVEAIRTALIKSSDVDMRNELPD